MDLLQFKVSTLLGVTAALYFVYKVVSFIRFYIIGLRTGFPILVTPIPATSILWMVFGSALQPLFPKYFPDWIRMRLDVVLNGWEFKWRTKIHDMLGKKTFVVVCPDGCYLWVADPVLGSTILQRRKEFIMPSVVKQFIGIFGGNLLQDNGEDWQRQRRIVAPNLNESIMTTVWAASCNQAQAMINHMIEHPGGETLSGLRSVAINVLGSAGYGQSQTWSPDFADSLGGQYEDARVAYFKTIALVTDQYVPAVLIPPFVKQLPFMPEWLRSLGRQMEKVPQYVKEIFEIESQKRQTAGSAEQSTAATATRSHNMLDMLLQYSQNRENKKSGLYLTEDELSGNLWVFTAAGFDTTATTMGYAVMLLTAYPEYQEWVREELRELDADVSQWKYEEDFPRCSRTLAVMLETLRLFTPALHSSRTVNGTQFVVDADGTHLLPSPMDVFVCQQVIHRDTSFWGADAAEFNPKRWMDGSTGQVIKPPKDIFLPWSGGPRICPGMKMAQVEFVATMAMLFRHARCEALPIDGRETQEEIRARLWKMMDESISKLTLQVKDPQKVQLRWVEV